MKLINVYCPNCGNNIATEGHAVRKMTHKWISLIREVPAYYCVWCGAEIPNPIRDKQIEKEMREDIETKYIAQNYSQNEIWNRTDKKIYKKPDTKPQKQNEI